MFKSIGVNKYNFWNLGLSIFEPYEKSWTRMPIYADFS